MAAIAWDRQLGGIDRAPLRLVVYRRRRLAALLLALALVVLAVQAAGVVLGRTGTAGRVPPAPVVLVAERGDTYWSLAGAVHDGGDIRSTVDAIVRANGGRELRAG